MRISDWSSDVCSSDLLDNFKAINDTYGHPAGDAILRAVGKALKRNTRESDYVARVGGDEFAVIMTHASLPQSEQLAEKLSGLVNGLIVPWKQATLAVSGSFGAATYNRLSQADTRSEEHTSALQSLMRT